MIYIPIIVVNFLCWHLFEVNGGDNVHGDIFADLWKNENSIGKILEMKKDVESCCNQKITKIALNPIKMEAKNDQQFLQNHEQKMQIKEAKHFVDQKSLKFAGESNFNVKDEEMSMDDVQKISKLVKLEVKAEQVSDEYLQNYNGKQNAKQIIDDQDQWSSRSDHEDQDSDSDQWLGTREQSSQDNLIDSNNENFDNDRKEKVLIIHEFDKLKKEYQKNNNKNCLIKIEQKIAKKLGTYRTNIYKWKKELGFSGRILSEQQKCEKINRFYELKKEYMSKIEIKGKSRKSAKNAKYPRDIEDDIAKQLGTSRSEIYRWKKKYGIKCPVPAKCSEQKKQELFEQLNKFKSNFEAEFNRKMTIEIERKIAKKIGISEKTLYKMKKDRGLIRKHNYTVEEKQQLIERYDKLQQKHPALSDAKIAKMLKINSKTIKSWKKCFNEFS